METLVASSPIGDAERLKVLRQLKIDDTRLDESLSDVVRQVGELFETTVCFINLVYLERQVFRAWFGAVPDELMRAGNTHDQSLCTYVVEQSAPLIIEDLLDSATWHEPFDWPSRVMTFYSGLGVRFYAGLPLLTSGGHALGTLCLIDMKPREMSGAALESLQFFAAKAAAELELASQSETARRLRQELEKTSLFASRLSDLLFRLQNVAEVQRVCDVGLGLIRDAVHLDFAALLTVDVDAHVTASVGELPAAQQPKLLRLIEDSEIRRVGDRIARKVDVRIVAATNQPLDLVVKAGRFREDLYYRLASLVIRLPDLADRREDIPLLAESLLVECAHAAGVRAKGFTPAAVERLAGYGWPGNVRELRNAIEQALFRTHGPVIDEGDVPAWVLGGLPTPAAPDAPAAKKDALSTLDEVERAHVERVLQVAGWNRSRAAEILGIDRRTLFTRIEKYGLVGPMRGPGDP